MGSDRGPATEKGIGDIGRADFSDKYAFISLFTTYIVSEYVSSYIDFE
jgi:hypothetical protein